METALDNRLIRRVRWLWMIVLVIPVVVAVASLRSRGSPSHISTERLARLNQLASAVVPAEQPAGTSCIEMANVAAAASARLAVLRDAGGVFKGTYRFDAAALATPGADCRKEAVATEAELKRSWRLFEVAEAWRENAPESSRTEKKWQRQLVRIDPLDITTPNNWSIIPGCITVARQASAGVCAGQAIAAPAALFGSDILNDGMMRRIEHLSRQANGQSTTRRGKTVALGASLDVPLDRPLQNRAIALLACMTGHHAPCAAVLPQHLLNDWHYRPGQLRTGAAAVMIVRLRDGAVVAAASSVSDCTLKNLTLPRSKVLVEGKTVTPIFRDGEPCPQLPDKNGNLAYLTEPGIFWMVHGGSTAKIEAFLAAIDAEKIPASQDPLMKSILAHSHDVNGGQKLPQHLAIQAGDFYINLMNYQGYSTTAKMTDALTGQFDPQDGPIGWRIRPRGGLTHTSYSIAYDDYLAVEKAKENRKNADALFGKNRIDEYLKAKTLAISAIGSGTYTNVFGMVDWARRLALRADGKNVVNATHFIELEAQPQPKVDLNFAKATSVARLLNMLSGITSSTAGGSAAGSCATAYKHCPAAGHPLFLWGKTGTSEATTNNRGEKSTAYFKDDVDDAPAKVFLTVFRSTNNELYAAAAMTLRARATPGSAIPELNQNGAAELVMLLAQPLLEP